VTASKPFLRLVEAGSEVIVASFKYGEKVVLGATGRERAEIESDLRQAKAVGQFTILMATAKAKGALSDLVGRDNSITDATATPESGRVEDDVILDVEPPQCIDDYDALTASQIVKLLSELSREERTDVLTYESANRNRNSILKELSRLG
jgi:hypothetical protein